jgi:riboflavin biosynthesis pyrimidine reductase
MSDTPITRVHPQPAREGLGDEDLAALYSEGADRRPWMRVNFVSSVDGAATHQGLSDGLSDDADQRVFEVLRRLCDVVVVGAGTVRAERYSAMRVSEASARWREAHGLTTHPVFAIVSASLDLDPASPIFADAPERPIILTTELARADTREALAEVADVMICGRERVQPDAMVARLAERGLDRIHCEGGPRLFGDLVAFAAFDELCLTLSPQLEAGPAMRIATGASPIAPVGLRLAHTLVAGDTLLLRYTRA